MVYNVNDVFQTIFNFHDIAWMRTVFVIISIFTYSVPKYKMLVMFMPYNATIQTDLCINFEIQFIQHIFVFIFTYIINKS